MKDKDITYGAVTLELRPFWTTEECGGNVGYHVHIIAIKASLHRKAEHSGIHKRSTHAGIIISGL